MAVAVPLPKLGNTVESSILVRWLKQVGDSVAIGEPLCEVETDKATLEVESPAHGVLLAQLYQVGDEMPVMVPLAIVGAVGEDYASLLPKTSPFAPADAVPEQAQQASTTRHDAPDPARRAAISPRARALAKRNHLPIAHLKGTGPRGRIIERDVQSALNTAGNFTPLARAMVETGDFLAPERGTGVGGKVTKKDLIPSRSAAAPTATSTLDEPDIEPLKGVRKLIAARMLESLQTTAQLTLNASADARALRAYRNRLKASDPALGLQSVTLNDVVLFAVSRTLRQFPQLNSLLIGDAIHRYRSVHLGMAVETERGLVVPVIRHAQTLGLKALSDEAHRLAEACLRGHISPDDLTGGTFTVTNLGSLGIESFTPILNPPQVAILGVGAIALKPVEVDEQVTFIPSLSLSLTVNHQVVDGAPAARFLQALSRNLAQIELLLSL